MNLLKRKIRTFALSNIVLSFAVTGFTGIRYIIPSKDSLSTGEELVEKEIEPVSHMGDIISNKIEEIVTKKKQEALKVTSVVTQKNVWSNVQYAPAVYSEVTGNAVVEYAKRYLGLRYVSGGNSLTYGTDCSGFTKLIYQEFGIYLSRSPGGQANSGTYVRKSDLQKGDLVFYSGGNGIISHVGMYIGNGQVLHQSNPRDGVKISPVNMMQYITARRVINSTAIKIVEDKIKEQEAKNQEVVSNTDSETIEEEKLNEEQKEDNSILENETKEEEKESIDNKNDLEIIDNKNIVENKEVSSKDENEKKEEVKEVTDNEEVKTQKNPE